VGIPRIAVRECHHVMVGMLRGRRQLLIIGWDLLPGSPLGATGVGAAAQHHGAQERGGALHHPAE
jgi:hypothetical protein